jgi:hypothetical protein
MPRHPDRRERRAQEDNARAQEAAAARKTAEPRPCPACGRPWTPTLTAPRVPLDIRCACCQQP